MKISGLKSNAIFSVRNCDGSYHWEFNFKLDDRNFRLFIVHNPSYIKGQWYCTATLRTPSNTNFEINYGVSNYMNTSKYVLKAIIMDLIIFEKTGKFSKYVSGYHNMFNPKDLLNIAL